MIDNENELRAACVNVSGGKSDNGWWPIGTILKFHPDMSDEDARFIALAAPVTVRQMFDTINNLRADLAAAQARIAALTAAVMQVEWLDFEGWYNGDENFECPWCNNAKRFGHAPDCPRQAALGLNHDA